MIPDDQIFNLLISILSLVVAATSLVIALIILFYTIYQFSLKRGSRFYGTFTISSSVWSRQHYVSYIIIENTKDKAAAINTIYLRIGKNIYLELIDYSNSPRILAPFETIKIAFEEGVSGYITSTYKVNIDSILSDYRAEKTLIVSTPQGNSKVKKYKSHWNIYIESLRNYFITPVHPVKKLHNNNYYSDQLQFIVSITSNEGNINEHYLYRDCKYSICNVEIKTNDFSNADELQSFLIDSKKTQEHLIVKKVEYCYRDYNKYQERNIRSYGFFKTYIVGAILTKFHRIKFHYNRKKKSN